MIILACIGFNSCTKEIPYVQDNFQPILVLNAIWAEGDSMSLEVTSSIGILEDTSRVTINNASVSISSSSVNYNVFNQGKGVYASSAICEAEKNYTIQVSAPGFQSVLATETVPQKLQSTFPDSADRVINNELIDVLIKDPSGANYYMIELKARRYKIRIDPFTQEMDSTLIWESIPFGNLNKIFVSDLEIVSKQTSYELFDDRLFDDKEYTLQVDIPRSSYSRTPVRSEVHFYELHLKSISAAYYRFLRNYLVARPIYGGPFESYREVPNNVQGGAGIFGLYSGERDTVYRRN